MQPAATRGAVHQHPGISLLTLRAVEKETLAAALATLHARFEYPTPRLALGARLRAVASACIDVSDGLYGDASKLAAASSCAVHIDPQRLPRSPALATAVAAGVFSGAEAEGFTASGGDDYELLFTMPQARWAEWQKGLADQSAAYQPVAITPIGYVEAHDGLRMTLAGKPVDRAALGIERSGWDHFSISA